MIVIPAIANIFAQVCMRRMQEAGESLTPRTPFSANYHGRTKIQNPLFGIILVLIVWSQWAKAGVSTPSSSGDIERKSKIIPDFFLSPFHSLISDSKIFLMNQLKIMPTVGTFLAKPLQYLAPVSNRRPSWDQRKRDDFV